MLDYMACMQIISIHALREEGDCQNSQQHSGAAAYFYPRPPRGGRLANLGEQPVKKKISIHALREEGDVGIHGVSSTSPIFLSTPSARRATIPIVSELKTGFEFLSTPSSRRATHPCLSILGKRAISIHALLAEGDCLRHSCGLHRKISIHALREEGDVTGCKLACRVKVFLSTPSARRATKHKKHHRFTKMNFYPRPPRGGRRMSRIVYR